MILTCCSPVNNSLELQRHATQEEKKLEAQLLIKVNQHLQQQGLKPLKSHPRLWRLARQHSQNIASGKVPYGHNGFDFRSSHAITILKVSNFAENIAIGVGNDPTSWVFNQWINSPEHHRNLAAGHELTGIGVARDARNRFVVTQVYATTAAPAKIY